MLGPTGMFGWPVVILIVILAIVGQVMNGFVRKLAWALVALLAVFAAWREIIGSGG